MLPFNDIEIILNTICTFNRNQDTRIFLNQLLSTVFGHFIFYSVSLRFMYPIMILKLSQILKLRSCIKVNCQY